MNRYIATPKIRALRFANLLGSVIIVNMKPAQKWRARMCDGEWWLNRKAGVTLRLPPAEAHRLFDIREEAPE